MRKKSPEGTSEKLRERREKVTPEIPMHEKRVNDFLEQAPERIRRLAHQEAILHDRLYPGVLEEEQSYKELQGMVDFLLEKAGFSKGFLRVKIFDSPIPDAHVQIFEKTIRISKAFIEVLKGSAEHMASVIAHEIGHVLLAHYKKEENLEMTKGGLTYDPLSEHIQSYEEEYQADRASAILCNRMGIPPTSLVNALEQLQEHGRKMREELGEKVNNNDAFEDTWRTLWIVNTHPHVTKRRAALLRDARGLPRYQRKFALRDIKIPEYIYDISADLKAWGDDSVFDFKKADAVVYPDCIWDEVEFPSELTSAKAHEGDPKTYIQKYARGFEVTKLPFSSEEVNAFNPLDHERELERWWLSAMTQCGDESAYDILAKEVEAYDLRTTKMLLHEVCPEFEVSNLSVYEKDDEHDVAWIKEEKITSALSGDDEREVKIEMMFVTSLLVKNWFQKDKELTKPKGFEEVCIFLRAFFERHGMHLPYTGARFFLAIEKGFLASETLSEQAKWAEICERYEEELTGGLRKDGVILARALMPKCIAWIESRATKKEVFERSKAMIFHGKNIPLQLPEQMISASNDPRISQEEAEERLRDIEKNYRPSNLTLRTWEFIKSEAEREEREGTPNVILELDPAHSAATMSEKRFEHEFLGSRRGNYKKTPYGSAEARRGAELPIIKELWRKMNGPARIKSLPKGKARLDFLLEHCRLVSAWRDAGIAKSLGLPELRFVESVIDVQAELLKITDIELLMVLRQVFLNPILTLTVSKRLWDICQNQGEKHFLTRVSEKEKEEKRQELYALHGGFFSEKVLALLLCYPFPSYVRDSLLRPFVDAAVNEKETLALASWYADPPPGELRLRTSERTALSESVTEIMSILPQRDKQELMLYFLGQRFFSSGIDAQFFPEKAHAINMYRKDAMILGERAFKEKYTFNDREKEREANGYVVSEPDALVLLTKASGIPVHMLLREQRDMTSRREQREFLVNILFEKHGLLTSGDNEIFLRAVARNIVHESTWGKHESQKIQKNIIDLLAFAFKECPKNRFPDLFLGLWYLQQDNKDLPDVAAGLVREMGSLFIKAGQYLGTQAGTLPPAWTDAFRKLADKNTDAEKTLVYEHEHAVYGEQSPFRRIGKKLGEGSMAAVYEGELKRSKKDDEQRVATKIFHPYGELEISEQVDFLAKLVEFLNKRKADFGIRLPSNLVEVSEAQIRAELSFENMKKNYRDIQDVLERSTSAIPWKILEIQEEISTKGFVVFPYSTGVSLDTLPSATRAYVQGEIGLELLRQILQEGTYQGDPNIGNFKVVLGTDGSVARVDWLDLDHVGRLSKEEMANLRRLIQELISTKNGEVIAECLRACIQGEEAHGREREIITWMQEKQVQENGVGNIEEILVAFLDFLAEKKLLLKDSHVTLLRTLGLMKPFMRDIPSEKLGNLFMSMST